MELHVSLDLLTETVNFATLTPDTDAEAQHLPDAQEVAQGFLLADRGYFKEKYLMDVDGAGGSFIVRGKANMNPSVRRAYRKDGSEIKAWQDTQLKEIKHRLRRYDSVDMDVEYCGDKEKFGCRLIVSTRPDDATPPYLVTNLTREQFSVAHVSDAYRLRWQIELLFKEWKSYSNMHALRLGGDLSIESERGRVPGSSSGTALPRGAEQRSACRCPLYSTKRPPRPTRFCYFCSAANFALPR